MIQKRYDDAHDHHVSFEVFAYSEPKSPWVKSYFVCKHVHNVK